MNSTEADEIDARDEEAAIWCMRLAESRLSMEEQRRFDAWLVGPGNSNAFEDAVRVWRLTESASGDLKLIAARSGALDQFRRANRRRWLRPTSRRRWGIGLVACVALLALVGSLLLHTPARLYETGIGEREVAMLDDGSRLSLDAATEVEVRMAKNRRQLRLVSGRAKFDVAKDPLRPFSVMVGDKLVVATGTSFSVELLKDRVHVLLYEGRVEVLENGGGGAKPRPLNLELASDPARRALAPGRELVAPLAGSTAFVNPVDLSRSLSWEAGQLSFENEPLSSAVERFNRYSHERLVVGPLVPGDIRINGVFDAGNTAAFVEGVTALHPVRAVHSDRRITFQSK